MFYLIILDFYIRKKIYIILYNILTNLINI